jgi:hypothetical protein
MFRDLRRLHDAMAGQQENQVNESRIALYKPHAIDLDRDIAFDGVGFG